MTTVTLGKAGLVERALSLLSEIEFELLKRKLQDPEEGLGWTSEQCNAAEQNYRRFLALKFAYPEEEIVPNQEVDKFGISISSIRRPTSVCLGASFITSLILV